MKKQKSLANTEISSNKKLSFKQIMSRYWQYYALLLLPVTFILIFHYQPMYGVQIAFKSFRMSDGITGSEWVGLANFERFFSYSSCKRIILNTIFLSLYSLIVSFPFSIMLALSLSYLKSNKYRKTVQMISYAPHFISTVVMVGIIQQFLSNYGFINNVRTLLGFEVYRFMADASLFNDIYVWSGEWQNVGFAAIIYIGIITSVDYQLHEAAIIDGASIVKRMWYIDLPTIIPTAITLLIMNVGKILNVGFDKVYLLQNSINTSVSEIISTYTYKLAFESSLPDYSYSSAVGLFQSLVGMILLLIVNQIARKVSDNGLW